MLRKSKACFYPYALKDDIGGILILRQLVFTAIVFYGNLDNLMKYRQFY